ncbi:uncharacterized protein RBU47_005666 isoform 2-T2 [Passerculus sandwichensis]
MGRSGRGSAGVFSPGPGHERGPEKGTGVWRAPPPPPPPPPASPSGSPSSAPRSHGPQPDGSQACQSRPAFLRPPCPITAALSNRKRSRQSQPAQSRLAASDWPRSPVRLRRRSRHRRFGSRRSSVPAAAASAGAVADGKGGRELPVQRALGRQWRQFGGEAGSDGSCGCAVRGAALRQDGTPAAADPGSAAPRCSEKHEQLLAAASRKLRSWS